MQPGLPERNAGFTLLEVLVVLVILGMASTILLQALGQVYRLQTRFGTQLAQSQGGAMFADWYRQVIQGVQTDVIGGAGVFKGSESELSGVSTTALTTEYGAPTRFTLTLNHDGGSDLTQVVYSSSSSRMNLMSWQGGGTARFVYQDEKGERHDQWPPPSGQWPQLPKLILLEWRADTPQLLVAVPRGSAEAKTATNFLLVTP